MTNLFPTDTAGLTDAVASETVELAADAEFRLEIGPVRKRLGITRFDARLQRVDPRPNAPRPRGVGNPGRRPQRGRPRGDRPLAWPAARKQLRRHPRDPAADPHRRRLLMPGAVPRSGPVLVPPTHPRGLRPGDGSLRQRRCRPARPRLLAASAPRARADARRRPIEDGKVAPFSRTETTYAAMGRFGNLLLIAGEPHLDLLGRQGEVVRLYFTNTANTRVFNVALPGARMKLVGGDSGRVEHEQFVDSVILAPSERVIVDVCSTSRATSSLSTRHPSAPIRSPTSTSARTAPSLRSRTRSPASDKPRVRRGARSAGAEARGRAGQDARLRR